MHCGAPLISPKDSELMMCTSCAKQVKQDVMRKTQNKENSGRKTIKLRLPDYMFADSVMQKARAKAKKKR